MKLPILLFFSILGFGAFCQQPIKEKIILDYYENCGSFSNTLYGGTESILNFEKYVLGISRDSILKMDIQKMEPFFEALFAKTNLQAEYKHKNGLYKKYPQAPICELYNLYINKLKRKDILVEAFESYNSMVEDSTESQNDSLSLTIIESCFPKKRKIIKVFENELGEGQFKIIEGNFFLEHRTDSNGKIDKWNTLKTQVIDEMLDEFKYYYDQYNIIALYPDGCSHSVGLSYKGEFSYFHYLNLEKDCEIAPGKTILTLLDLIENSID